MQDFCQRENIPIDVCGKVIVAVDESEMSRLQKIFERGQANGIACEMIDQSRLAELEPHTAGVAAIHVPEAGILDYRQVAERLAEIVTERGGEIRLGARVTGFRVASDQVVVSSTSGDVTARFAITCAGLQADRVTRLTGQEPEAPIVPFRGEYFDLSPQSQHLCRNLIYPVPDPSFPFLGVHFTRMIHGGVECGPNAVLAFAREGYTKTTFNPRDLAAALSYRGFQRLAARHWRTGAGEMWRSFSKGAFVKALQRLVPEIQGHDLTPAPAGVRAMALARDGSLLDDFVIQQAPRVINVLNAPSPAATASLNIGRLIVDRLAEQLAPGTPAASRAPE